MSPKRLKNSRENRAVVLLLVLWIMVVLSLIAYSVIFQVTTETSITTSRKKYLKAQALARAGIAKAIIDLKNDMLYDTVEETGPFDAEGDVWARPEEAKTEVVLGDDEETDGYFNTRVYDEDGLFNLNEMTPANMMLLQKIIESIGYEEEDARDVAAIIVDWRDGDTIPSLANSSNNEEGIAFAIMMNEDLGGETDPDDVQPLRFRNENYATVEELLEVPGVTPELFFGPGSDEAIYYSKILPPYDGGRFQIKERRRSRFDDKIVGLRDYFTVHGIGRLNINTAPAHVLAAFAEAAGNTDGERWADRIISNRRGGKDDDLDNSRAYRASSTSQEASTPLESHPSHSRSSRKASSATSAPRSTSPSFANSDNCNATKVSSSWIAPANDATRIPVVTTAAKTAKTNCRSTTPLSGLSRFIGNN